MPYPTPQQPLSGSTTQSDPGALPNLSGLFWEPTEAADDYHHQSRGAGLLQIPGNLLQNIGDWGQGLSVMGSQVGARILETTAGQPIIRQDDGTNALNFAKAILDDYKTGYVDPIVNGRPADLYRRAATRPLDVASDALMLAPGVKAAGKLPGVARVAESVKLGAAGARQRLFGAVEQAALRDQGTVGNVARAWQEKATRDSIVTPSARAAYEQFLKDKAALDAAHAILSPEEALNLRGKLEGWDPEVLRGQAMSEGMQEYHQAAGRLDLDNQNRLSPMGHVSAEQAWREKWKPMVKQWFRSVYGVEAPEDLMKLPPDKFAKLLHAVSVYFKKRGIQPVHVPRMKEGNIRRVLREPGEIEPWMLKHQMRNTGAGLGVGDAVKSPFEYERTALETGAEFSNDAHSSILARRLQVLQAHELFTRMMSAVMDASADISRLTPEQIAVLDKDPAVMRFRPREFFGSIMDQAPVTTAFDTTQTVQRIFAEEVFIPTPLAKALTNLKPWKVGSMERFLQGFANFARRYILGFNFLWPEKQFGQNLSMLGMFQFRGPKDALVSFASYVLMTKPEIRALVPELIKGEAFAGEAAAPAFGGRLGQAQAAVEKVVDFTFQRGQFYDRLSRGVAGVYYALKLSESPALAGPIRGMLTTGEAINRMELVFSNTAHMQQVNQKVITVLGDYSRLAAKERQAIRSCLLWWMWYEHILKYAAALPANAPMKTALMGAIAQTHTRLREDADGDAEGMPEGLKKAGAVKLYGMENDQEIPQYLMAGSLTPLATISELVEFFRQPVEGSESSTVVGAMNPLFTFGVALMGINPQTGREFRDPRLVSIGGRQYDYHELQQGLLNEKHPRPLMAGGLEYAMRTIFPTPTRLAERVFAKVTTGGEPSQFTSVLSGEAAPRVVYDSGGEPLAAGSVWDIVKEAMLGFRAFPIDEEANKQNASIDRYRLRKALRAAPRQINTTEE